MRDPPPSFLCPISQELMLDPVTCTDGHSYDRRYIVTWLAENNTSPATGLPLSSRVLIPNIALRNAIDEWEDAQHQPSPRSSPWTSPSGHGVDTPSASSAAPSSASAATPMAADSADDDADASDAALKPGAAVLYTDARGEERCARVVSVHPGGADDPTPFYTILLDGGGERDTIRSRLQLLEPPRPSPPRAQQQQQQGEEEAATAARREEEESSRREAVARSRREAKQERRRRAQEAAAAAEASTSRNAQAPPPPPPHPFHSFAYGRAPPPPIPPPRAGPWRPAGPADDFEQAVREAGEALNRASQEVGESLRGAADAIGSAFRDLGQFLEGAGGPQSGARHASAARPHRY
eukprot:jgi/Chrpa1/18611/Chrysochromulina_OHIO_Genome00009121-RA